MEPKECDKEVEDLEKEAKFTIISMNDDHEDEKQKILDDAKDQITHLYKEFREWLANNIHSDEVNERMERLKQETANLLNRTKASIQAFNEREDVIHGKTKAKEFGAKVVDSVNNGFDEVMKNEHVNKVVDTITDTIDNVREDERVREGVHKFKKGTLKIAESAFNGLKRVLDTDDDQDEDQKG